MKSKQIVCILWVALLALMTFACAAKETTPSTADAPTTSAVTENAAQSAATETPTQQPDQSAAETDTASATSISTENTAPVRVAALAGPTGIGLTYLLKLSDAYTLDLFTAPDQVTAKILSGDVDIAAVPINLASVLYNKTEGKVAVIAVNTLGVLYFLENGDTIHSVQDLAGKTIYATGQASTPQYILEQILAQNDLEEKVTVEYLADNTELIGKLTAGEAEVALLPEPHVSIACAQSEKVHIALSANELWQAHNEGTLVQGVYIVRRDYLDAHKEAVDQFLLDAAASAEKVLTEENAPAAVVEMGIIGKEPIAKRAIPNCNIVLKTGEEMRSLVSDMLAVLHKANPKSVGGNLPDTEFYYVP